MPDSPLGRLQERVATLEQLVKDTVARFAERMSDLTVEVRASREASDRDYRSFAPTVHELNEVKAEVKFMRASLTSLLDGQKELEARFDVEREERIEGQRARKEELENAIAERNAEMRRIEEVREQRERELREDQEKRDGELRAAALQAKVENRRLLYGIIGIFITAAGGVAAQILGGGSM